VHDVDVSISYGAPRDQPGVVTHALGTERIVPLCAPTLLRAGMDASALIACLPLIDSQLSRVTWSDWFGLNGLTMPDVQRTSFDRAALAISAAVDEMGVALESTRLAERELSRGELVELGGDTFAPLARETHFVSYRANESHVPKVKAFRTWLWAEAGLGAPGETSR
jgi:LysR family glycine cleavage system transcriptional activator